MKDYVVETGRELYDVKAPPMLIDPFLPAGCLAGLSGEPGRGKSWFALEACRAVATGTPFLSRFAVQTQVPVLYIGSDSSRFDYGRCWRRLTKKQYDAIGGQLLGEDPTDVRDEGECGSIGDLNPLSDRVRFIIGSDFSLDDPARVDGMIKAVDYEWGPYYHTEDEPGEINIDGEADIVPGGWKRQHGAGLIIMDTFGSLTDKDLIDNSAMIGVYRQLRRFVERTKATVLLLNHNPHNRESWLGAISQVGKLDFWLHLKKAPKQPDPDCIQIVFKKVRGIKPKVPILYRMHVSDPDEASLVCEATTPTTPSDAPAANDDSDRTLVLGLLEQGPRQMGEFVAAKQEGWDGAPTKEAARKAMERVLTKLEDEKVVEAQREPGKPTLYTLNGAAD